MATQLTAVYNLWDAKPYTCEYGVNTTIGNRFKHNKTG